MASPGQQRASRGHAEVEATARDERRAMSSERVKAFGRDVRCRRLALNMSLESLA